MLVSGRVDGSMHGSHVFLQIPLVILMSILLDLESTGIRRIIYIYTCVCTYTYSICCTFNP